MTPDERQWCLDELARQGCTHGTHFATYNPHTELLSCEYPSQRCISIWLTSAQISQFAAQTKAASANAPNTPTPVRHILSQHGGKPIPVVTSHSAIAAMKKAQPPSELKLDYKTHVLLAVRRDSRDGIAILQAWRSLPSQAEIDATVASAGAEFTSYALVAPVNTW